MAYNYKDVFYLSATHETTSGTYASANVEGIAPLDVSAYVDPIARGKSKGTGLALYKVHMDASGNASGSVIPDAKFKPNSPLGNLVLGVASSNIL